MSTDDRSLLGSVFERTTLYPSSAPSSRFTPTPGTGFPTAQHRFKSAFARARDGAIAKGAGRQNGVPSVVSTQSINDAKPIPTDTDALGRQIHEENARRIARMSDEEIEEEKQAILEQLGDGTVELLKRVQDARSRKEQQEKEAQVQAVLEEQPAREVRRETEDALNDRGDDAHQMDGHDSDYIPFIASPSPHRVSEGLAARPSVLRVKSLDNISRPAPSPVPAASSTRPSSRTGRKLRFAEVTPDDVHVYESAPISPKRAVLALPPPPDTKDDSIVSLGTFKQDTIPSKRPHPIEGATDDRLPPAPKDDNEPEEGTPEYIRRRYFPNVPENDPSLAWMEVSSRETTDLSSPRFDLHGTPIPVSLSSSLPSHLGLHHHAEGSHAGYTMDDIFLLSRSTVPAQRASMLGILARISHYLGRQVRDPDNPEKIDAFAGKEGELRKRIMAAGLAAIDQIGSLGARAVEVVWACLVEWNKIANEVDDIELSLAPDIVSSLQLAYFLPQVTDVISHAALPAESLEQLLAVIHWLSQQSNKVADMITTTPRLIPTILNTFLLTPIPPRGDSLPPNPLVFQLLITLASASRSNASALLDPADALLRFVAICPSSSPYSPALAATLLTYTLRFYATLASYGLYAHIATTVSQVLTPLAEYIPSIDSTNAFASDSISTQLRASWASLVEAWIVCATDPHATRPPHEILWSQVSAWGWATDIRKLMEGLGADRPHWPIYAAIWDAEAAWLEGARINGVKGGEGERDKVLQILRVSFHSQDGTEFGVVRRALEAVQHDLGGVSPTTTQDGERVLKSLASATTVLASALRLFLACLPPLNDGTSLSAPPFTLPLSELSALSATLIKHSIWSLPTSLGAAYLRVHLRPLTRLIIQFHRVSRYIPGTTPQLLFVQALVFLSRLLPGDESHAFAMLDAFSHVTPQFVGVDPAELPQGIDVDVLRPFLEFTMRPEGEVYVAPLRPSTESIARSSTLRLPPPSPPPGLNEGDDPDVHTARTFSAGLPLTRDFMFAPLTHLLRSGTSPVFGALPANWTASEVDVVRATLLLALAARRVLVAHGLAEFVHDAAEVVFACMRVCMLEHGVGFGGTEMEVYRDDGVERLMSLLLEPFTMRGAASDQRLTTPHARTLEDASASYLGSTPFYQFYTDLVALYGAVSFGHRIFAALVVTPLATRYPVDYRRALWCGGDGAPGDSGDGSKGGGGGASLGDVVRNVRIPIEDVVCTVGQGDVREYLYPIERDAGVLGAYVAALVASDRGRGGVGVDGFLRLVAVHHVACTVWADLVVDVADEAEATRREETRARLLRVMLVHGEADVVRDVVLYRQRARGAFVLEPTCYQGGDDGTGDDGWREERVAFVRQSMGESAAERVGTLLKRRGLIL